VARARVREVFCIHRCEDLGSPTAVTVFGIAAVVFAWYLIGTQTSDFLDLLLTYVSPASLPLRLTPGREPSLPRSYMQLMSVVYGFGSWSTYQPSETWSWIAALFRVAASWSSHLWASFYGRFVGSKASMTGSNGLTRL
jgi:hypothetical protein